jgi:hypothetical protein
MVAMGDCSDLWCLEEEMTASMPVVRKGGKGKGQRAHYFSYKELPSALTLTVVLAAKLPLVPACLLSLVFSTFY